MTIKQSRIIAKIEMLITDLSFSDKEGKAKGEIESIKTYLRQTRRALDKIENIKS